MVNGDIRIRFHPYPISSVSNTNSSLVSRRRTAAWLLVRCGSGSPTIARRREWWPPTAPTDARRRGRTWLLRLCSEQGLCRNEADQQQRSQSEHARTRNPHTDYHISGNACGIRLSLSRDDEVASLTLLARFGCLSAGYSSKCFLFLYLR